MSEKRSGAMLVILGAAGACALFAVMLVMAHVRASSFNRLTGRNVSAWDAMWTHLEVTSPISEPSGD